MCVLGKWAALNKAILLCAFAILPFTNFAQASCPEADFIISGSWGEAAFKVALARTPEQRNRGLMFVTDLPDQSGMLFVYPNPQSVSFWMKNTSIPLDIIFADSNGLILKVFKNAVPFSQASIFGGNNVQYVIEINAGLTEALDIVTGNFIKNILVAPMN